MNFHNYKQYLFILGFIIAFGVQGFEFTDKTVLVLGKDAVPAEITAANELQKYLKRITGKKSSIVSKFPKSANCIVIGTGKIARSIVPNIDFEKLKNDEVILKTVGSNTLLVAGARPRGTLYAVYELLERELKVLFLSVNHEIIPKYSKWLIPKLNYRYAPPFAYREIHSELFIKNHDLATKWRLNGSMFRKKIPTALGGFYQMDMSHSLVKRYVKSKKWFKTKPEWFSFRKKQNARVPEQLCFSNPEVIAQIVKEVLAEQKTMPKRRFIGIGAADNNQVCQCEKCLKLYQYHGTTGAGTWKAVNAIAKAISDKYPKSEVLNMAYWSTERPPENLELEPNVSVVLAMIDRNHGLPPSSAPRFDIYLKKYNQLTNNKVYIWDYYANFANFLLPTPQLSVIAPALRTYKRNHVNGIFVQLPFGSLAEFLDYRNYLFAKLAWNPDLDSKKMMHEYFKAHYGKAASFLLAYIELLNKARDRQKGTWIGCYLTTTAHWLTVQDILKANVLFKKALALTASNPQVHKRVKGLEASIILVNIKRYKEVAAAYQKAGIKLKSRKALIDQLEKLGKEFKCGPYKEWDSFANLIKKLRKKDTSKIIKKGKSEYHIIPVEKMKGQFTKVVNGIATSQSQQIRTGFHWIDPKFGIYYVVEPKLAGRWNVSVTLRCTPKVGISPAAAYLGIYAPYEVCRQSVKGIEGDSSWQKINLGKFYLPPKSKIWIMPGVIKYAPAIEVKSIELHR